MLRRGVCDSGHVMHAHMISLQNKERIFRAVGSLEGLACHKDE